MQHRHWECTRAEPLRAQLSPELLQHAAQWPVCTRERGWFVEPSELREFKHMLAAVTLLIYRSAGPIPQQKVYDLFADGGCKSPKFPTARLSSSAISLAVDDPSFHSFRYLEGGGVPGQWQTVLRAELTAVIMAVCFGICMPTPIRIWCDNNTVVTRMRKLQQGRISLKLNMPDHDLW